VSTVANERDPEVCEVIDELVSPWKIPTQANFYICERVPERDQAISQQIDAQEMGVGENLRSGWSLKLKRAGDSSLASRMAQVRLLFESRDWYRAEHNRKPTNY
jgi:hypothetical protein